MHSQSQAWEVMLSQHAMCQPIIALEDHIISACNAVKTLPIKEPVEAQKDEEGEGRDFSGSLA